MMRREKSYAAAIVLFFVAPLVAEYLLGDFPLTMISLLAVLAPLYGGGALLIRELARRTGRGWPTMLLLGAAYALIEEGFATQSLFNPDIFHLHGHFLTHAWIPALGIGGWWTVLMFNVHTFWSMGVSIALVEALFPARAKSPWLGKIGDSVVAAIFLAGVVMNAAFSIRSSHFMATPAQFAVTGAVCVLLVCAAFLLPFPRIHDQAGAVPSAWLTGGGALLLGLVLTTTPPGWNWGAVGFMSLIDVVFLVFAGLLSRRSRWTALHTLSLGAAGAVTYGVKAFIQPPVAGGSNHAAVLASHIVLLCAAIAVIAVCVRRVRAALATGSAGASGDPAQAS